MINLAESKIELFIYNPQFWFLITLTIGLILVGVHVWYENTNRSQNWIEDLKSETSCEDIDNALSWSNRPFVDEMVKFAEQRKQVLNCP